MMLPVPLVASEAVVPAETPAFSCKLPLFPVPRLSAPELLTVPVAVNALSVVKEKLFCVVVPADDAPSVTGCP